MSKMMVEVSDFSYGGKQYKTVFVNGKPEPIATKMLINLQDSWQNGASYAWYCRSILDFIINEKGIHDYREIKLHNIREFAEMLKGEGKGNSVLKVYSVVVDRFFDTLYEANVLPNETLISGDAILIAGGGGKTSGCHYTKAGLVIRRQIDKRADRAAYRDMITYTKWLSPGDIKAVSSAMSLRNRCVFLITVETGYRISSALSIALNRQDIESFRVNENFSKTGKIHAAQIDQELQSELLHYIDFERANIVKVTGKKSDALFLTLDGNPLSREAYTKALKRVEEKIHRTNPQMLHLILHTHSGRSTFFNRLIRKNFELKQAGKGYLSDQRIQYLMDWKNLDCLYAYYDYWEEHNGESTLFEDLFGPD